MARGILHSKSFLPNIYKTWSMFDQYLKTNLRSTPDIQSNGSYAHTIKIEECEWVKHEKVVVVLHGGFGSEMGRVGKLEGGLNHDCDMSRSRMRGRHSRHSTLQCPSSVWLSFNHICSYEKKYRFYYNLYVYFPLILLNIAADVKQANESEDRPIPPVPVAIITFAPLDWEQPLSFLVLAARTKKLTRCSHHVERK